MTVSISKQQESEAERWVREPIVWARKFGGDRFDPWSGQEEFWIEYGKLLGAKIKRWQKLPMTDEEKRYARKLGISIMAGQGVGKGATISLCGLHYMWVLQSVRPKIVCTAPAGPQLHSSLWPEYGEWLQRNPILAEVFEKNSHRIFLKEDAGRGTVSRIEPRTVQPNASPEDQKVVLAGVHALGVMYQVDEGSGVPEAVFEPLEGGLTDPLSMIILLFNPTKRDGFAMETHRRNREQWVPLQWDGEVLAAEKRKPENYGRFAWFNEEVQESHAKKYGKDSDFYRVRVKGLPPNQSGDMLISFESVMAATTRVLEPLDTDPLSMAVDVGGPNRGADPSIVIPLRGPQLLDIFKYQGADGTQLREKVAGHMGGYLSSLHSGVQYALGVDVIGIGRGVYEQLRDIEKFRVHAIDVSRKPLNEARYHRLRDQIYWELREAFMDHAEISLRVLKRGVPWMDELMDTMIAELTSIRWAEVEGKIKVQGKGLSSGIPHVPPLANSPDESDGLAMAWYLYKHCCSRVPPGARRQRRQRNTNTDGAMLGFRSMAARMGRIR